MKWRNGQCRCTTEELQSVLNAPAEAWDKGENALVGNDIALIRLVCSRVLLARRDRHFDGEKLALRRSGVTDGNWGRRGQHVDAISYVTRNVVPDLRWTGHSRSAKSQRRFERAFERSNRRLAALRYNVGDELGPGDAETREKYAELLSEVRRKAFGLD